jgi:hypothetical protein
MSVKRIVRVKTEICVSCGELKKIMARNLCPKCYALDQEKSKAKACKGCGKIQPIKAKGLCRRCYARFQRHGHTNSTAKIKGVKLCEKCGMKPVHAKLMCKSCYSKYLREKDPTKQWEYNLQRQYGLSVDEYNSILNEQKGKCAICGETENEAMRGKAMKFAVDHDHATGVIRGLLCGNCNRGIGNLQDSITTMTNAIDYLKKHASSEA